MGRATRLLATLGLLPASTVAVFALLEAAPGGPIAVYLGNPHIGTNGILLLERELGPGQPFLAQYVAWLFHILIGELGWSPSNSEPVSQAIAERLPATLELAFVAFFAVIVLGAAIGFARARLRVPALRRIVTASQLVFRALPVAILALFFQLLFMFTTAPPAAGSAAIAAFDARDRLVYLMEPVLAVALPFGAWASVIFYDFFPAADATVRISARSLAGPVARTVASIGPALLAAVLVVEPWSARPGIARLFYNGLSQRDVGVVAGVLLSYSIGVVLLKLCAEVAGRIEDSTLPHQDMVPHLDPSRTKRFSTLSIVASVVLLCAVCAALAANLIARADPYYIDQEHWTGYSLAPGVAGHVLGTDENGRDLLSRLLFGLRTSLGIAAVAAAIAAAIGVLVAQAAKVFKWPDDRGALAVTGIRPFAALPFILAAVMLFVARSHTVAIVNPFSIALIIAVASWPAVVPAFRALTPATFSGVVKVAACALLLEVTLSMYGYGIQPPTPSLGNMLANAQSNLFQGPWIPIVPTVIIVVTLFALYAIGDELRIRTADKT